jgi:hypothetical protein
VFDEDFVYLNLPALLARKAWTVAETGALVEDQEWVQRFSERLFSLVQFFRCHNLLKVEAGENISNLVLRFSDFTEEGKRLIKSGATDKWLASFDRDPNKASNDVSYLVRRLKGLK